MEINKETGRFQFIDKNKPIHNDIQRVKPIKDRRNGKTFAERNEEKNNQDIENPYGEPIFSRNETKDEAKDEVKNEIRFNPDGSCSYFFKRREFKTEAEREENALMIKRYFEEIFSSKYKKEAEVKKIYPALVPKKYSALTKNPLTENLKRKKFEDRSINHKNNLKPNLEDIFFYKKNTNIFDGRKFSEATKNNVLKNI